jgi:hypothetical protein
MSTPRFSASQASQGWSTVRGTYVLIPIMKLHNESAPTEAGDLLISHVWV